MNNQLSNGDTKNCRSTSNYEFNIDKKASSSKAERESEGTRLENYKDSTELAMNAMLFVALDNRNPKLQPYQY